MVDQEVVAAVRARLARRIGEQRYELWFGSQTELAIRAETLRVVAPSQFFRDWLRRHFREALEDCFREVTGRTPDLEFAVDVALAQDAAGEGETAPSEGKPSGGGQQPSNPAAGDNGARARRSRGRRFASLDSMVAGFGNKLALTSAQMVIEQLGKLSPLFVYGPTAVGKTHLLEGIYKEVRKDRQAQVVYLSAEQFTSYFVDAVRGSGLPNFRRKYRGVDLLIIDDVQFFSGKPGTINELLHTIDTALREGRQLVFAADRPPADLPDLGNELLTRLESGLVCAMHAPDQAVRLGIVRQLGQELELSVPKDVAEFVAANLTAHARELAGAMKLLKATCLARACRLTLAVAQEALAETIRNNAPLVRLGDIDQAVCNVFGLEPQTLQSRSTSKSVSHPRMLAMWLARKYTRVALTEIGRYFGRRSHSSVIAAQKKVNRWMTGGEALRVVGQPWTAEEAIRRVEERLRVG